MPIRLSHDGLTETESRDHLLWFTAEVDWPIEQVCLELEVGSPTELTPLEWAVLRILDDFAGAMPAMQEVVEELGVGDEIFLRETLARLLEEGAVEQFAAEAVELASCRLTVQGQEWLRHGRLKGPLERPGVLFHLDAVTGEHLPIPPDDCLPAPRVNLFPADSLPSRTTTLGLDRVRGLCQAQGEIFHQNDSRILSATVREALGSVVWLPVQLSMWVHRSGRLALAAEPGTPGRGKWPLENLATVINVLAPSTTDLVEPMQTPMSAASWRTHVCTLIAPDRVAESACRFIDQADREILVHSGLLELPGVQEAIDRAASRGVRCYLHAAGDSQLQWFDHANAGPGFVWSPAGSESHAAVTLIIDGTRGLRFDWVAFAKTGGGDSVLRIASTLQSAVVPGLRKSTAASLVDGLDESDPRQLFVKFALTADLELWSRRNRELASAGSRVENLETLVQWARWGQSVLPHEAPPGGWFAQALESWWSSCEQSFSTSPGTWEAFLPFGIDLIPPTEVVNRLSRLVKTAATTVDSAPLERLLALGVLVVRHWPGFEPVAQCAAFRKTLRACLANGNADLPLAAAEATRLLSGMSLSQAQREQCARWLWEALPPVTDLETLCTWLEASEAMLAERPPAFQRRAVRALRAISPAIDSAQAQHHSQVRELTALWTRLQLPKRELEQVVPPAGAGKVSPGTGKNVITSARNS
jgi:hypothetical protein